MSRNYVRSLLILSLSGPALESTLPMENVTATPVCTVCCSTLLGLHRAARADEAVLLFYLHASGGFGGPVVWPQWRFEPSCTFHYYTSGALLAYTPDPAETLAA